MHLQKLQGLSSFCLNQARRQLAWNFFCANFVLRMAVVGDKAMHHLVAISPHPMQRCFGWCLETVRTLTTFSDSRLRLLKLHQCILSWNYTEETFLYGRISICIRHHPSSSTLERCISVFPSFPPSKFLLGLGISDWFFGKKKTGKTVLPVYR